MEGNQIGIFKDFWDGNHPHHLPLMNLRDDTKNKDWNVKVSLQRIEKIFQENDRQKVIQDLVLLIKQNNWRPQLIFCISILRVKEEEISNLKKELWNKLEEYGSWIIPQLAATASIVDPDFKKKAKEVLKNKRKIDDLNTLNSDEILTELSRGNNQFENKSLIAIRWKENLLKLIKEGKIKTEYKQL
ncbi:MAG: hypothetical protein AB8F94_02595 [Saprospiraceae bacterium]